MFKEVFGHSPIQPSFNKVIKNVPRMSNSRTSSNQQNPTRKSTRIKLKVNYRDIQIVSKVKRRLSHKQDEPKKVESSENPSSNVYTFVCLMCDKTFKYKNSLSKHFKAMHTEMEFRCDVCGNVFNYMSNLKRHKDMTHSEEKVKHECKICENNFSYKSSLMKHIKKYLK